MQYYPVPLPHLVMPPENQNLILSILIKHLQSVEQDGIPEEIPKLEFWTFVFSYALDSVKERPKLKPCPNVIFKSGNRFLLRLVDDRSTPTHPHDCCCFTVRFSCLAYLMHIVQCPYFLSKNGQVSEGYK